MDGPTASTSLSLNRILVRGVNWLGDAVMSTPALQRLREKFPGTRITLFAPKKLADVWKSYPHLDELISFDRAQSPFSAARQLRERAFDLALVLPNSPRSALEVWLAGIPQRIGYARPWRNWFLSRALPPRPGQVRMQKRSAREINRLVAKAGSTDALKTVQTYSPEAHQVHDYLHLVAALGANPEPVTPRFYLEPDETEAARAKLRSMLGDKAQHEATSGVVLMGMNPSAAYGPAKRWPAERFAAVAREVSKKQPGVVWVALGEATDRELCEQIAGQAGAGARFLNVAGETSLRELMALLSACKLLLTNDSGPMHLAAALGTSVIVPFGSTSPAVTGPGLPGDSRHHVFTARAPCSPCFRRTCPIDFRCMTGISVEEVAREILQRTSSLDK